MGSTTVWIGHMMPEDKTFYQELRQRIAWFRNAQGGTQPQLAKELNISQHTMAHYEVGRFRIAVAMLASTLAVSIEGLVSGTVPTTAEGKRGPTTALQRLIEQVAQLPRTKQKFVREMLETVIQQQRAS